MSSTIITYNNNDNFMHVCMYVCMYVRMYACMYVCVCMYACMHACSLVCVCVCVGLYCQPPRGKPGNAPQRIYPLWRVANDSSSGPCRVVETRLPWSWPTKGLPMHTVHAMHTLHTARGGPSCRSGPRYCLWPAFMPCGALGLNSMLPIGYSVSHSLCMTHLIKIQCF